MNREQERVELAEYARIVWKRKWMVLLPTVLVAATAWTGLRFITPRYVSHALIEITDQDVVESLADEFAEQNRRGTRRDRPRDFDQQQVRQINQQVTGQRFLGPVGRRLGLDQDPQMLAAAKNMQARLPDLKVEDLVVYAYTARLKDKVAVEPAGIALYQFNCTDEDPHFAYALARAVADEYLVYTLGEGIEVVGRTQEFSAEQLERYQRLLTQAEDALQAKQRDVQGRALSTLNPVTPANFAETKRLVDEANLEIATLERRIQRGIERLPASLGGITGVEGKVSSARLAELSDVLRQSERSQVSLTIQGLASGAVAHVVGSEVSRNRQEIFAEIQEQVARAYSQLGLDDQQQIRDIVYDRRTLTSVVARRDRVQELLGQYSASVVHAPEVELEVRRLQEEVDRYRTLVANIEQRRITDDLRKHAQEASVSARVKIIEPPAVPLRPAWPDRAKVLLFAFLAGPLLGLGAVILAEYMDTSLRTVEEVEQELGLPVLGTVPRLVPSNLRAARKRMRRSSSSKRSGAAGAAGALLLLAAGTSEARMRPAAAPPDGGPARPASSEVDHPW